MRSKKKKAERVPKSLNVGVVGLGCIGASLCMRLSKNGAINIIGCDTDADTLDTAFRKGMIHLGSANLNILRGCEVVFAAVPVMAVGRVLREIYDVVGDSAIITDVAGVKGALVGALPEGARFVGGHPMTGSERSGINAARAEFFDGCTYVLTRMVDTADADFEFVRELVESLGAVAVEADAAEHDLAAAQVSHLPHMLAYLLANGVAEEGLAAKMAAGSFRDMTRVADSPAEFWRGIAELNRGALLCSIENFERRLVTLKELIAVGNYDAVQELFEEARAQRARILASKKQKHTD